MGGACLTPDLRVGAHVTGNHSTPPGTSGPLPAQPDLPRADAGCRRQPCTAIELRTVDVSNDLIALGGAATGALALATAWSSELTRRLVKEGKLSRDQWTAIAVDSARTRLDQNAATVDLTYGEFTGPLLPSTMLDGRANPCPPATTWNFPRDQQTMLAVRSAMKLTNSSEKIVYGKAVGAILIESIPNSGERVLDTEHSFSLSPGQAWSFWLEARAPLAEWALNYKYAEAGEVGHTPAWGSVWITVHDDNDNGVDDWWYPMLIGTPIVPIKDVAAGWRLRPPGDPKTVYFDSGPAPQRSRTYWLSRSQSMVLPQPPALAAHYAEMEKKNKKRREQLTAELEKQIASRSESSNNSPLR